jgi:hypothetical protein
VQTSDHWEDEDGEMVVPQTQHSDGIGKKMSAACMAVLLGASPDEEEIASAVLEGADAEAATAALRKLACEGAEQPCHKFEGASGHNWNSRIVS